LEINVVQRCRYDLLFFLVQKFYGDEFRNANLQESDSIQKLRQATKLQVAN